MQAYVSLGTTRTYRLKQAVLLYEGDGQSFATVHDVIENTEGEAPLLGPGQALGSTFLQVLSGQLLGSLAPEVLPANVLSRTPDSIAWWTPTQQRPLFFRTNDEGLARLNGRMYPHPALVFRVVGTELAVRALPTSTRPEAATGLMIAPYWNTYDDGKVCGGSMAVPSQLTLETYPQWERAFFESEFTHAGGATKLTRYKGGVLALWRKLIDTEEFPVEQLVTSNQQLQDFILTR
jgi:PRTRC genetic system protein B